MPFGSGFQHCKPSVRNGLHSFKRKFFKWQFVLISIRFILSIHLDLPETGTYTLVVTVLNLIKYS